MIITINIPKSYVKAYQILIEQGEFPSRSEAIRVALSAFLQKELSLAGKLLDLQEPRPKKPLKKRASSKLDMRSIRVGW